MHTARRPLPNACMSRDPSPRPPAPPATLCGQRLYHSGATRRGQCPLQRPDGGSFNFVCCSPAAATVEPVRRGACAPATSRPGTREPVQVEPHAHRDSARTGTSQRLTSVRGREDARAGQRHPPGPSLPTVIPSTALFLMWPVDVGWLAVHARSQLPAGKRDPWHSVLKTCLLGGHSYVLHLPLLEKPRRPVLCPSASIASHCSCWASFSTHPSHCDQRGKISFIPRRQLPVVQVPSTIVHRTALHVFIPLRCLSSQLP